MDDTTMAAAEEMEPPMTETEMTQKNDDATGEATEASADDVDDVGDDDEIENGDDDNSAETMEEENSTHSYPDSIDEIASEEVKTEEKKEEERLDDSFATVVVQRDIIAAAAAAATDSIHDHGQDKNSDSKPLSGLEDEMEMNVRAIELNGVGDNDPKTGIETATKEIEIMQQKTAVIESDTKAATPEAQTEDEERSSQLPMSVQDESILVELQSSLQHQMTLRAEVENKLRNQAAEIDRYKARLDEYSDMEDKLEVANASLTRVVAERVNLEQEVGRLRDGRDDLERKEVVLSNRLNDAKKKEASKSNAAGRLERENEELKQELEQVKGELKTAIAQKDKVEHSIEKLKKKCVERVKLIEAALVEERNLNEERKKKMKVFVETKAEDLRSAKTANDELRTELKETSAALQTVRGKLEHVTQQFDNAATKNRELTREMNRMKKNAEQMLTLGDNLEFELHKSAQETEEHKNKRLTAKHELMTILRKLEAEQGVNSKLRDSIKFTFTPKALSQQQLLNESLQDFESELFKLARRLGKTLLPSDYATSETVGYGDTGDGSDESAEGRNGTTSTENGHKKAHSRSEWDATRLLANLEHETQHVSKGIMALSSSVERMRTLLDDSGEKTCASTLNEIFNTIAAARADGAVPLQSVGGDFDDDDEDGSFVGNSNQVKKKQTRSSEQFGLVRSGIS